jgi:hypothetical protein
LENFEFRSVRKLDAPRNAVFERWIEIGWPRRISKYFAGITAMDWAAELDCADRFSVGQFHQSRLQPCRFQSGLYYQFLYRSADRIERHEA